MDLKSELAKRTTFFNSYWGRYLQSGTPASLYEAARHLPLAGGKRIRPFLAMVSCECVGGDAKKVLSFAAALELMHNFTLVHDDIMDKSLLRRSLPTVHVKFGEPAAILSGDLLFAKSFEALLDVPVEFPVFQRLEQGFIRCVIDICEGQQLDMGFEQRKTVSEQEYLGMIRKKTGALFELSAKGGALVGDGTEKEIDALATYGMSLGLAFQIWDDYLDMSSDAATLGKDIGNDIRNGKKTLIAVHSLSHASGKQKKLLDAVFGNRKASEDEVKQVFAAFQDVGSVEYARTLAMSYNKKAKDAIKGLKSSEATALLGALVDYSIQREK